MFAILQRNAMESPSATRLSPNTLSPPPGLLPTLPVASTPANHCAVLVKQEVNEQVAGFDQSPYTPAPTLDNVKLENEEESKVRDSVPGLANGADPELLKQKLEMYWQGMIHNYQQELQKQQDYETSAVNLPNLMKNERSLHSESPKSPDVLEKAKNVVQRLIEDDNKSKSKDFKMPWPSLAAMAANRQSRSPQNGQKNNISNLSPDGMKDSNFKQASMLSQQALATMLSLQQIQQQHSTQVPSSLNLGGLLPPPPQTTVNGINFLSTSIKQDYSVASDLSTTSLTTSTKPFSGFPVNLPSTKGTSLSPTSGPNDETNVKSNLDAPLDLSLSSSEKHRIPSGQPRTTPKPPAQTNKLLRLPPPLLRVGQKKELNYSPDINQNQINLANTVNSQIYTSSPQQIAVEAHIKNSLSNNVLPTSGPFTSLYQTQETAGQMLRMALAAAGGKTLNELVQSGVPPIQIQQWLLTAMSAQKVQQMALNQLSMIHQQANADHAPPKKRQKLNTELAHPTSLPMTQGPPQSGIFHQQNNMLLNTFSNQALAQQENNARSNQHSPHVNRKTKSSPSTASAENDQNQSGKRYRRYAKPPYSYVSLITLSILSSRDKKLRLAQILNRISEMFPFFNGTYQGWRDSVRHNLSQNECFVKVLKNPYRPTAKGNFWTVNLNSIPHELLLRQNTLVSRYAQDSGYRYRKDLSEVFDLRTGALKVPVPRQLIKEGDMQTPVLNDDPAAVMEAILLEETSDDEMSEYKDKVPPEVKSFTLEDLFNQSDDAEEDMTSSRGRRNKQNHGGNSHSQPPTLIPKSFSSSLFSSKPSFMSTDTSPTMVNNFQTSLHHRVLETNNLPLGMMPTPLHPISSTQNEQPPLPLPTSPSQNPFASAQTALLSKAMATQLQGLTSFPVFQKMLYANQLAQSHANATNAINVNTGRTKTPSPTHSSEGIGGLSPGNVNSSMEDLAKIQTNMVSMKRNKRKGVQPVRHATHEEYAQADESMEAPVLSPHHSMPFLIPTRATSTPSRAPSSEAESATTNSSNPFSSPIMSSSSSKSHSSPHHNDSSELDESSHMQNIFSISARDNLDASLAGFQALQRFNPQSLQASKLA